jgi:hypothetical protein
METKEERQLVKEEVNSTSVPEVQAEVLEVSEKTAAKKVKTKQLPHASRTLPCGQEHARGRRAVNT